eukprot:SAG31_NODE_2118_length_6410_cov_3.846142_7_plen_70_part_00
MPLLPNTGHMSSALDTAEIQLRPYLPDDMGCIPVRLELLGQQRFIERQTVRSNSSDLRVPAKRLPRVYD